MKIDLDKRKLVLNLFKQLKPYRQIQGATGISLNILIPWKRRFLDGDTSWSEGDYHKKNLSVEEQFEIVRLHTLENKSKAELASRFGVNLCAIAYILRKFKNQEKKTKQTITERQILKEIIVSKIRSGELKSGTQAAEHFGLNGRTVRRWIRSAKLEKDYYQKDDSTKEEDLSMRFSLTTQLSQKAEIKNWIVREFNLKDRSRPNLVRLIEEIRKKGVPVKEACQWLQVCRSSYYRWRNNRGGEPEEPIVAQIRAYQEAHSYAYGAKRMAVYLSRKNKEPVNHKKIARLMKLHGLNSKVRRKKIQRIGKCADVSNEPRKDLLKRNFESNAPFQKMVTDMTFVPVVEGWLVLSAIKDLCSKKIVSYAFGASATVELALKTLKGLPQHLQEAVSERLLHSDQGSCYTSSTYREAVSGMGINCSFSRRGNCLDNACIESFFGHLKSETIYRLSPAERLRLTRRQAQGILEKYITWYNEERIQRSLGYQSPEEVISSFVALRD